MNLRSRFHALLLIPILLAIPTSVLAAPAFYLVQPNESDIGLTASAFLTVDSDPDPLDQFPDFHQVTGTSTSSPTFASSAIVDVGLPGNFNDGANGITFSSLSIVYADTHRSQVLGGVALPTGGTPQLAGAYFDIEGFSIVLDAPFSASLTPGANPNEYLWAGTASVTVSGDLSATFEIPTVQSVSSPSTPFSQSLTVALAGTFSGDQTGTEVTVGIPTDDLQNLNLSIPPFSDTIDLLGLFDISIDFQDFLIANASGAVVYRNNSVPIPEPGTAALLGIGLLALGLRRRR